MANDTTVIDDELRHLSAVLDSVETILAEDAVLRFLNDFATSGMPDRYLLAIFRALEELCSAADEDSQ
jgi:hypothetical protein